MTPEQRERIKWLDREDAKEKRRRERALSYSPGEQIWMGFWFVIAAILLAPALV